MIESNLFEYGEPVTSSEVNFKNLFRNFSHYVKNSKDIDLLSYKYICVIKNRKQAKDFVKKNIYPNALGWSYTTISETGKPSEIIIETSSTIGTNKSELDKIIKTLAEEYIQVNYEVYLIKFTCLLKTYEYYVFVDPETKKVVTKGNIFGVSFSVPISN
jgi:hypothetical protein